MSTVCREGRGWRVGVAPGKKHQIDSERPSRSLKRKRFGQSASGSRTGQTESPKQSHSFHRALFSFWRKHIGLAIFHGLGNGIRDGLSLALEITLLNVDSSVIALKKVGHGWLDIDECFQPRLINVLKERAHFHLWTLSAIWSQTQASHDILCRIVYEWAFPSVEGIFVGKTILHVQYRENRQDGMAHWFL